MKLNFKVWSRWVFVFGFFWGFLSAMLVYWLIL